MLSCMQLANHARNKWASTKRHCIAQLRKLCCAGCLPGSDVHTKNKPLALPVIFLQMQLSASSRRLPSNLPVRLASVAVRSK